MKESALTHTERDIDRQKHTHTYTDTHRYIHTHIQRKLPPAAKEIKRTPKGPKLPSS